MNFSVSAYYRLFLILFLTSFFQFSYGQDEWSDYAAHQQCLGSCYEQSHTCEFNALLTWYDCWRYCEDNYGPNSGPFEYSPYVSYYHELCESACDYTFDQAYYYCDIAFDNCECNCIRSSAGLWGYIFGIDC